MKPNATERDQWRSAEILSDELRHLQAADRALVQTLFGPLLGELRFPSAGERQARAVLALVVNTHAPAINSYVVPELIESLRTASDSVRLQIRNVVLAIQKADYPGVKLPDTLAKWEPKKDESPSDIDERVRAWHAWWQTAERAPLPRQGMHR